MNLNDTIAAIATPVGEGGIGIVRVSGPASLEIAEAIFETGKGKPKNIKSRRLYVGRVRDDGGVIDEVCLVFMKGPRTYTTQDTVEISCHGSPAILRRVLRLVLSRGARMAGPGEFTKRAFLNGRIDLSQAEGVIDLIKARSEGAAKAAFHLMEGGLSSRIDAVRQKLVWILSHLEASLDFPDEELETAGDDELLGQLDSAIARMAHLVKSYEAGQFLKHGMGLVIIGKPNAGKSSLLNALLEEDRAIVTPHAGTTRDVIKVQAEIAGLPVELMDTAGLNPSPDEVEAIGMKKAYAAAESADAVIALFDGSREWDGADDAVLEVLGRSRRYLAVINKADLPQELSWPDDAIKPIHLSVAERRGLEKLLASIRSLAGEAGTDMVEEPLVTRTRHLDIFRRITDDLGRARNDFHMGREVAAANIWDAIEEIKRFTGESYTEEVISAIFDEFCVGK